MFKLFKYKSFILFLIFLAIIVPFENAYAGGVVDFFTSITNTLFDITISISNIIVNAPLAIAEYTIGKTVGVIIPGVGDFFVGDGGCRWENMGNNAIAVYNGECGGSQAAAGVTLVSTDAQSNQCSYSIPVAFYIPSFNYGYRDAAKYCHSTDGDNWVCDPLPSGTQRYRAPNFGESGYTDSEYWPVGYNCLISDPQGAYAKIDTEYGQQCSGIQITYEQGSIIEGNKIAVYRFSAPVSQFQNSSGVVDNNALGQWFMGLSGQIGNGWTAASYFTGGNDSSLAILDYSQACQGNVCTITDNVNVPQDSYIVYAAKILGNYVGSEEVGSGEDSQTIYPVKQNKFLSKDNLGNGILASLPAGASIGNAYLGPFKTGVIPADCGYTATSTQSVPQINITPSQLDFTATKGSNSSNQGTQNVIIRNSGN